MYSLVPVKSLRLVYGPFYLAIRRIFKDFLRNHQHYFKKTGKYMRIGTGYDVHRLTSGRKLILGGVAIPFEKGLFGHSDADVLVHSICDALLGAAGLGDIGLHFPDTDPEFKDISSIKLLEKTYQMVTKKGFNLVNIDSTVFAQEPKISPFREKMQQNIARAMNVNKNCINIKATTTEGLGMFGRGDGMGAMSVVLIESKMSQN
jgi:2-C-methyl-D-erythritol 2,4-cyclodiphosphate synthase